MSIKIKRLHPDAVIPKYVHAGDSGFDLVAVDDVIVEPGKTVKVPTGIAFELPEGYELQIRPRSGITLKTKLRVQLGTCDAGYRGEVGVIVDNIAPLNTEIPSDYGPVMISGDIYRMTGDLPRFSYIIRKGDRIAQGVIAPIAKVEFEEVDKLSDTERGNKGFGSTGVN